MGLGSWQGGLCEPGKRQQNWKSPSVRLPNPDIRDVSNSISCMNPIMCYISRESTVCNFCNSAYLMKSEAEDTQQCRLFFPMACNFSLSLVTNRSTFPLQHPLIVLAWCFCLKS